MKVAVVLTRVPFPLMKGDKLRAYYQIKELFELNNKRVDSLEIYRTSIKKMEEDINNFKEYMEECGIFFL